jgi:uncharacterized protein (DUF305 family)
MTYNRKNILIVGGVLLLGIVTGLTTSHFSGKNLNSHQMPDGTIMENSPATANHDIHMNMMVKSEQEFVATMIPHHEEAITAAREVLARGGTTPEVKKLATAIIDTQTIEVAQLKDWHQNWYNSSYIDNQSYSPMMRNLSRLSLDELDKAFLEDMIIHHEGAIMMADSVTPYITHNEIKLLAEAIKTTQSAEVNEMKSLLETKY